jgi:hypothetical protein
MMPAPEDRPITQILRDAGYGHRSSGDCLNHMIFRLDTGEEIGWMSAGRAVEWMREQGILPALTGGVAA